MGRDCLAPCRDVQGANALPVKAHVFGEGLPYKQLHALLDEVSHRPAVLQKASACKALIGHVEEGQKLLVLAERAELLPLLLSEVDARGIVGGCVKDDDRPVFPCAEELHHLIEVDALELVRVIGVLFAAQTHSLSHFLVDGPARIGNIDRYLQIL